MILIVNVCFEKLHYLEFVKPVEDILVKNNVKFKTKHYKEINQKDLGADKIIICGTSLKDDDYLDNISEFNWIKDCKKPVLGICAGMQIIGLIFGGKLKRKTEIGFYFEEFDSFLGISGKQEVYHLHNNYVEFSKDFEVLSKGKIPQVVKKGNLYGVLFHPEVRQKDLILNFC
jgi:GMP synthase (glutamine-hydrolysing)